MKSHSKLLLLVLFLFATVSFGQVSKWERLYAKADSLAIFSEFLLSHELLDSILYEMELKKINSPILELKVKSLKGYCYERQELMDKSLVLTLESIEKGEELNQYSLVGFNYIQLALLYEKTGDLENCYKSLIVSHEYVLEHNLDSLLPILYIRYSSFFRFNEQPDSVLKYANLALAKGEKYGGQVITDALLMLSSYYKDNPSVAQEYLYRAKNRFLEVNDFDGAGWMYFNMSDYYFNKNLFNKALLYVDSGLFYCKKSDIGVNALFYERKATIYEKQNKLDSSLRYLKLYTETYVEEISSKQSVAINEIKSKYQSQKKDEIITYEKKKNEVQYQVMMGAFFLLLIIVIFGFTLYRTNKKLKKSNQLIILKTEELTQSVEQKGLLLSEIHHRVKNNLQTIIGILGLQIKSSKEKTLKEITRETQDRVKSMATLHNKVHENNGNLIVDFEEYLQEITKSLTESHVNEAKNVTFKFSASAIKLTIDQSIPLGLILVELVNNSFKYAFNESNQGVIEIELTRQEGSEKNYLFVYQDNGIGIADNKKSTGMGTGIIQGLVKQIKGTIEYINKKGIYVEIKF